jgi:hypothetical protein
MKNRRVSFLVIIGILISITMGCNTEDDFTNTPEVVNQIVTSGTWHITYFWDTDHDETNSFSGYNFTFGENNVLTATNSNNTYSGIWSVTDSNSNDDSMDDLDFNILFSDPAQFNELSDDWEILEKSSTVIKLKDVSGGNGGTDYLTFTKN